MTDSGLLESVLTNPVAAVLNRRSILLLLEDSWHVDRPTYWARFFATMDPTVSGVVRIAFAESLARVASADTDLHELVQHLLEPEPYPHALSAYRFVCEFAAAVPAIIELEPWLQLASASSQLPDDSARAHALRLVRRILQKRKPTGQLRARAARAARGLFAKAWTRGASLESLPIVIDTIDADPAETIRILEVIVDPNSPHPKKHEALDTLASHIEDLFLAPLLVGKIYEQFVAYEAEREAEQKRAIAIWTAALDRAEAEGRERPSMPARVIHGGALNGTYFLQQRAEAFVRAAPAIATAAFASAASHWERTTGARTKDVNEVTLSVATGRFTIEARPCDRIHEYRHFLIEHAVDALITVVSDHRAPERAVVLAELVRIPAPAYIWGALIQSTATDELLRTWLIPLFSDPVALQLFPEPISDALFAARDGLPAEVRPAISEAIQTLADSYEKHLLQRSFASPQATTSAEDVLTATVSRIDNEDAVDMARFDLSFEEISRPANVRIREASRRAWNECARLEPHRRGSANVDPSIRADVDEVLTQLGEALTDDQANSVFVTSGWCVLARLASLSVIVFGAHDALVFEAAARTDGEAHPTSDLLNNGQFFPRAEAVPGLLVIATRDKSEEAATYIDRLSLDAEPAVRFQVAWRLRELATLGRERAWPILDRLVRDSDVFVAAAATSEIRPFYQLDHDGGLALATYAFDRFVGATDADHEGRTDALLQLTWYHLARAERVASDVVARAIEQLPMRATGIDRLMHSYRGWLTMGRGDDEAEESARRRTVDLFTKLAIRCIHALRTSENGRDPNAQQRTERDEYANLLEDVAMQLYFASGAFAAKDQSEPMPLESTARFYDEFCDVLVRIGTAGAVSASNRVLKTLEYLQTIAGSTNIDSADVLKRFTVVAESAVKAGAANTFWMLDSVENVLRRCVAERDPTLSTPMMLAAWERILNPLLDHGWEQAYALAYELDLSR